MNKIESVKEHIALREQFFEYNYNPIQYAYGFVRTIMHSQERIEGASAGIRVLINDYGTHSCLKNSLVGNREI